MTPPTQALFLGLALGALLARLIPPPGCWIMVERWLVSAGIEWSEDATMKLDLNQLASTDRQELETFASFLRARAKTADKQQAVQVWVREDPEARREWLGLTKAEVPVEEPTE